MYCGYVVKVDKLKPHPNADKLVLAEFFGNTTCVSVDTYYGEMGIYFPSDLQLSVEYCDANHLCRKDVNGNADSGYLERNSRHIKAIKLRGERSDGIFMPIGSLAFTGVNLEELNVGDTIDIVNGVQICGKYIPRGQNKTYGEGIRKPRLPKVDYAPLFAEHKDTEQLAYNLSAFKSGDQIEITLKMHGTSGRTAYVPVAHPRKQNFIQKLFHRPVHYDYSWDYVSGTRRTICENFEGGFYGSNAFRQKYHDFFCGKLCKGETVYYKIVGYTQDYKPIMSSGEVPKEYQRIYGATMEFHYGNQPPESAIYVYRMTMTNEDGDVVEYSPDYMRYRCEQMGVECVPVFWKGYIPEHPASDVDNTIEAGEWVKNVAEQYYDGPDPIGKTHVREGVVVRIINRPSFTAYKHKNWIFKYISGIITEKVANSDEEMSEDILSEL